MGYRNTTMRLGAVGALLGAQGDLKTATAIFKLKFPHHGLSKVDRFIAKWGKEWNQRGNVTSLQKSGRPKAMPDQVVRSCATLFKLGRNHGGQRRHFASIQHAVDCLPALQRALATHPISNRTLLKRMHEVDPGLVRRMESVKPALGATLKKQRRRISAFMLRKPLAYFKRIHWIDMKTMYIAPKKRLVWTDAAWGAPTVEDHRAAVSSGHVVRLKFYASVCWATGAADLKFVTGTSPKAVKVKKYVVRSPLPGQLSLVIHQTWNVDMSWPECILLVCPAEGLGEHPESDLGLLDASLKRHADELLEAGCIFVMQSQQFEVELPAPVIEGLICLLLTLN